MSTFTISTEGTIPFTVQGETHQTWYKVFGDLATRTKRPLVVLHGGPGISHDYLLPLSDLTTHSSIPVILYDQLGSARSTHLTDKPADFWSIDLFIDELVNLLSHFGIQHDFDILGHSWGGMLGSEFVVRRQPIGLKHLILANSLTDFHLWNESIAQMRKKCSQEVQDALRLNEEAGTVDNPEYQKAAMTFYGTYACLVRPMPSEIVYSLQQADIYPTVFKTMSSGEMKDWKITDRLDQIKVPTLVIRGEHDMGQAFVSEGFVQNIPGAKVAHFKNSSHTPHWEEREKYMAEVKAFVTDGQS